MEAGLTLYLSHWLLPIPSTSSFPCFWRSVLNFISLPFVETNKMGLSLSKHSIVFTFRLYKIDITLPDIFCNLYLLSLVFARFTHNGISFCHSFTFHCCIIFHSVSSHSLWWAHKRFFCFLKQYCYGYSYIHIFIYLCTGFSWLKN